jgi:hypothetical protein
MVDKYYGMRFHISEDTDIGSTVLFEYECPILEAPELRKNVMSQLDNLRKDNPDKTYSFKEEVLNDQNWTG